MKNSRIPSVILSVLVTSVLLIQCSKKQDEQNSTKNTIINVEAVRAQKRVVSETVTASSLVRGYHEVYVAAETPGTIVRNNLKLGKYVPKGTLLLQIESAIHKAAYEQMESLYNTASINYEAVKELYEQGNASKVELLKAKSDMSEALSGLKAKKRTYSKCFLRSPVNGYIASAADALDIGNTLSGGKIICRITDIQKLKTTIHVSEKDLPFINSGSDVSVYINSLDKTFQGKVSGVSAGSSPSTGSYPVEVIFDNDSRMSVKSGMSAFVKIFSDRKDTIQTLPVSCITNEGSVAKIFKAENNRAVSRYIHTGDIFNNNQIILKEPLDDNTEVIISGTTVLTEGDSVSVSIVEQEE